MEQDNAEFGGYSGCRPDKIALIMSDGTGSLSYGELDRYSHVLAGQLARDGLLPGDHIAILMENRLDFLIAAWAAQRAGFYYTVVNWHLTASEVIYIIEDCGAKVLLSSPVQDELLIHVRNACPELRTWLCEAGGTSGFARHEGEPLEPALYTPLEGSSMIYSSGTSGRPKGIKRALSTERFGAVNAGDQMLRKLYGFNEHTIFFCPAPLYHAAPLSFTMSVQRAGGTVVLMPRFDAGDALDVIGREKVTAAWLVPTMMTRLLRLPEDRRKAIDISYLTHVIHSAAPCPVELKQAMMDWWGPVLYEFYSSTEANGMTAITPQEWLQHPGSVGRSEDVRIVDEAGTVLDDNKVGVVYFANSWLTFEYHNDPEKTADSIDQRGWTTVGDMGYLDADGYLYLTDRKSHMIISGGVNIYPQEVESILSLHPLVLDVAVIGVPNTDYGEEVKAVVQLCDASSASPSLAAELVDYCQQRLAKYKCPRSVDFVEDFPRLPTGKLLKRIIRARYWPSADRMI